ncbi:hypothetical protein Tco_0676867 [Tanacetum coccineum]
MPPKRTSTSATPAMTQDAIRQLVADSVATALKAQAANMANTDNTNKNTRTSGTPIARKGINNHKRKFEDRGNTTNNNNYPKHNNNNHSNNRNNNNYQDNNNKNNHNNDYHQQQNRRQETFRTYTATNGYAGNLPLCKRCRLHHTGPCSVKCQHVYSVIEQSYGTEWLMDMMMANTCYPSHYLAILNETEQSCYYLPFASLKFSNMSKRLLEFQLLIVKKFVYAPPDLFKDLRFCSSILSYEKLVLFLIFLRLWRSREGWMITTCFLSGKHLSEKKEFLRIKHGEAFEMEAH